ncbi:MAG: hypothetical protein J6Q38_01030 [Clostridia bacterium]|nr:hypothetical protein [Clostridia bacterium]
MKIEKCYNKIVCDVVGCNKLARYYVKKDVNDNPSDSFKLCPDCAKSLLKVLSGLSELKGKSNE